MDLTNEIFIRLQNGENVEDIASELTKNINEANNKHLQAQEEARKAEEVAKQQDQLRADKVAAIEDLLGCIEDILILWDQGDSELVDEIEDMKAEDIVDTIDSLVPFIVKYAKISNEFQKEIGEKTKSDDPLENFLNSFVR